MNEETDMLSMASGASNAMISYKLQELKKRKLLLKDRIAALEALITSHRPKQ